MFGHQANSHSIIVVPFLFQEAETPSARVFSKIRNRLALLSEKIIALAVSSHSWLRALKQCTEPQSRSWPVCSHPRRHPLAAPAFRNLPRCYRRQRAGGGGKVPGRESSPLSSRSWLGRGNNPEVTWHPAGLAPSGGHVLVHSLNSSIERQV